MRYYLFSVLSVLAADWDIMQMKHAWNSVPMNWENLGAPPAGTTITLNIFLKPRHENALIDALYEVSDPENLKYGAHLTKEQVADLLAPLPDTLELVNLWLKHRGVSSSISTTQGGSWLTLTGRNIVLRTVSYALPAVLHAHVDTVVPTTYFGSPRAQMKTPRVQRNDTAAHISPSVLRSLYKTESYVPAAAGRNVLGTVGYDSGGHYVGPSLMDLRKFMDIFRNDGVDTTFTLVQLNGGKYDPSNPGGEGDLNIEYASAIAYPTPNVYYSVGEALEDGYIAWLHDVLDQLIVPQTIVTTYELCNLFAALGARGRQLGVGPEDCTVTDSFGNVHIQFTPLFPASCPYLTAVGGTTSKNPEIAADFSGAYQDNAVQTFLHKFGSRYHGFYNVEGRGYPDISAQGLDFITIHRQRVDFRSGTSCAAPTVGAIISLLNDYRISHGKPPLGFLNPWLYGSGFEGLNDITFGSNPGCKTKGFPAIVGWDPVTGHGTPDFEKLLRIVEKMRSRAYSRRAKPDRLTQTA
ncbi:peptidase S8/S53 domain-containing protein [Lactarius quietus]|nr:peptidase S8/S53 domain-containing protein [Lactarius quietus]